MPISLVQKPSFLFFAGSGLRSSNWRRIVEARTDLGSFCTYDGRSPVSSLWAEVARSAPQLGQNFCESLSNFFPQVLQYIPMINTSFSRIQAWI